MYCTGLVPHQSLNGKKLFSRELNMCLCCFSFSYTTSIQTQSAASYHLRHEVCWSSFDSKIRLLQYWRDRLGSLYEIAPQNCRGSLGEIKVNPRGPDLHVSEAMDQPLERLKKNSRDKYLQSVPNQPGFSGYVGLRAAASNNLTDRRNSSDGPRPSWGIETSLCQRRKVL